MPAVKRHGDEASRSRTKNKMNPSSFDYSRTNGIYSSGSSNEINFTDGLIHEVKTEIAVDADLEYASIGTDLYSYEKSPRVQIEQIIENEENCTHQTAHPKNRNIKPLLGQDDDVGSKPKKFSFQPDLFQLRAFRCIDYHQSVLVSAHTSAGKTAVALYAIAAALRSGKKVIYTSPIKALSNQKYRELAEEFADVGLLTGDVSLNPDASCLVMTTEILRNKFYTGNEFMQSVGWVIFDEVHYMKDKERGVVWEEAIILLPDEVRYVFLSATIPNARQFAEWVCYIHKQPCHVVTNHSRPVPLQHFLYPVGGDGLYEVVDIEGRFCATEFSAAMDFLTKQIKNNDEKKKNKENVPSSSIPTIIRTIAERDLLPCLVFSFSRKECENHATSLIEMDFNTENEKKLVKIMFDNSLSTLSKDASLYHFVAFKRFLLRGIGIHHSGMLPILKEITEILFSKSLIKVLFVTETFAMGLDMPAKTVIFSSARKFDGHNNRWISSSEYIQMSGRAGRRGKDARGVVILMVNQKMSADVSRHIIKGEADPLDSQFRLTNEMVLNLYSSHCTPEMMVQKSFRNYQNYCLLPTLHQRVCDAKLNLEKFQVKNLREIEAYHNLEKKIKVVKQAIRVSVLEPKLVVPFFQPGRMLRIKWKDLDFGWGVLVDYMKKPNPANPLTAKMLHVVEVAVRLSLDSLHYIKTNVSKIRPISDGEKGIVEVVPFTFDCITAVSTIRIKLPQSLYSANARKHLRHAIEATYDRMADIIPELNPITHMKIVDQSLKKNMDLLTELEEKYKNHSIKSHLDFDDIYDSYKAKLKLEEELKQAIDNFKQAKNMNLDKNLESTKRLLLSLDYVDTDGQLTPKGKIACEIKSGDALLLTELVCSFGHNPAFNDLTPECWAAVLSCFVCGPGVPVSKLNANLEECYKNFKMFANKMAKYMTEKDISLHVENYVESFGAQLMNIVYSWCSGTSTPDILTKTPIFEGTIINGIRRLEQLVREVITAIQLDSSPPNCKLLKKKHLDVLSISLKRQIAFASSLYL